MNRLYRKFIHKSARQYFDLSKGQTIRKKICRLPIFTSRFFWGVLKNPVREFPFYPETTKSSLQLNVEITIIPKYNNKRQLRIFYFLF